MAEAAVNGVSRGRVNGSLRVTSRDYAHPYRPFPLGLINSIGTGFENMGVSRPLKTESIIRSAAGAAGVDSDADWLSNDYREGLEVLVDSINSEARLNTVGKMITRGRLTSALKTRFNAETLINADPGLLETPLSPPIIITGLQRTGTTLLHRLMAADRRFRSLSSWEVLNPLPPGKKSGEDSRIKTARWTEKAASWMSPDFFAVHPIDYQAPEEDVLLLDYSFRSTVAEAILRVPSYSSWLESVDSEPAYRFMRKLLLLFQSTESRPFWILKTPHHLEYLDVLLSVFPEARVIQGHRDPSKTIGSFLSMVSHGHGMFSDSPDPLEIGEHWMRKCLRMTTRGMAHRNRLTREAESRQFLDVHFSNLVSNPLSVLEDIYHFIGLDFDKEAEATARKLIEGHGRYRYGRHDYQLLDFGFTTPDIRDTFSEYRWKYNVPDED